MQTLVTVLMLLALMAGIAVGLVWASGALVGVIA